MLDRVAMVHYYIKRQRFSHLLHSIGVDAKAESPTESDVEGLFPIVLTIAENLGDAFGFGL